MDFPVGYYVYRLIDPRDGLPFYVGKGQRDRAWTHERDVRSGKAAGNARKRARIEELVRFGHAVEVEIVAVYDLESEALDHEFRLVDESPTLTNIMPGGGGGRLSAEASARRAAARLIRLNKVRQRERQAAMAIEAEAKRQEYLASVSTDRAKQQVAEWLESLSERDAQRVLAPRAHRAIMASDAVKGRRVPKEQKRRRQRGRKNRRIEIHDHQTP